MATPCLRWSGPLLMIAAALAGCERRRDAHPEPPPPTVTVVHPVTQRVMEWDEYTGRLEAVEFVEVRARVGGLITSAPFKEGSLVAEGDVLFEIDVRPFQAALDAREAAVSEAAAQVQLAEIEYRRIESIPGAARSRTEVDTAAAMLARAEALLAAAQAQVETARLDVEWSRVTAPIAGRVSRKLVTPGNLISGGSGQGTLLTTITSVDPIYCYVDADERSVLKYAEMARAGQRVSAREARIPCEMQLANETGFPHHGVVDFVDNRVDPATGTIRGRGVFPNTDGTLLPGYFARLRVPGSGAYEAILVPDAAVVADLNQKLLLVVDEQSIVQQHPVKLGALFGDLRSIESGITTGDRVIVNGLMQARPGVLVSVVDSAIPADALPEALPEQPDAAEAPATDAARNPSGPPAAPPALERHPAAPPPASGSQPATPGGGP